MDSPLRHLLEIPYDELPDNIHDAIRLFKASKHAPELLGAEVHEKYLWSQL